MAWFKLDDMFWANRKVRRAGESIGVWVMAATWSAHEETDGRIERGDARFAASGFADVDAHIDRLIDVGLFTLDGDVLVIPDFLDYNPSAAEQQAKRDAERDRQQAKRKKPAPTPNQADSNTEPTPQQAGNVLEPTPNQADDVLNTPVPVPLTTHLYSDSRSDPELSTGEGQKLADRELIDELTAHRSVPHRRAITDAVFAARARGHTVEAVRLVGVRYRRTAERVAALAAMAKDPPVVVDDGLAAVRSIPARADPPPAGLRDALGPSRTRRAMVSA